MLQLEDDAETRIADLDVLEQMALKYESLEKFLSEFALDPPSTQFQNQARPLIDESEEPPLTLSTIHSAKGLEWYAVFIPHLLDGLFPNARS
ncbi:MAG TPA: 3'-5' exonuclease, partial [Chitinophagales bacterium]|nr:3'-5' exonuclease [Chitinophagales bacterium]